MPYKYDETGAIATTEVDGVRLPVFIHEDKKESPFDADSALRTIRDRNREAKENRESRQAAEKLLEGFKGIDDPAAARKALDLTKNYTPEQLAQAGQIDSIKANMKTQHEAQMKELQERNTSLENRWQKTAKSNAFNGSKFLKDNTVLTPDIAEAFFGNSFKVGDDGSLTALDSKGNPLLSRVKVGEPATFEEAIEILVTDYPQRESILRGTNVSGSGTKNGDNTTVRDGNKPTMKRATFDASDEVTRRQHLGKGGVVVD